MAELVLPLGQIVGAAQRIGVGGAKDAFIVVSSAGPGAKRLVIMAGMRVIAGEIVTTLQCGRLICAEKACAVGEYLFLCFDSLFVAVRVVVVERKLMAACESVGMVRTKQVLFFLEYLFL